MQPQCLFLTKASIPSMSWEGLALVNPAHKKFCISVAIQAGSSVKINMATPSFSNNSSPSPLNMVCNKTIFILAAFKAITPGIIKCASAFKFCIESGTIAANILFTSPYAANTSLDPLFKFSPE